MPSNVFDFERSRWEIEHASGLPRAEKDYRLSALRAIREKVEAAGAHIARPHADRAQQFMPFAALNGYEDLVQAEEAAVLGKEEERLGQHEPDDAASWEGDDPC